MSGSEEWGAKVEIYSSCSSCSGSKEKHFGSLRPKFPLICIILGDLRGLRVGAHYPWHPQIASEYFEAIHVNLESIQYSMQKPSFLQALVYSHSYGL